jgi:hypothetical protein
MLRDRQAKRGEGRPAEPSRGCDAVRAPAEEERGGEVERRQHPAVGIVAQQQQGRQHGRSAGDRDRTGVECGGHVGAPSKSAARRARALARPGLTTPWTVV